MTDTSNHTPTSASAKSSGDARPSAANTSKKAGKTGDDGNTARLGRIIAVASGKGGVGKTWMSITLCHAFARRGLKTLLFDGDLGLANVDVQLGLMAEVNLTAVAQGSQTLKGVSRCYPDGGFDIAAGSSGTASLSSLSNQRLRELIEQIRQVRSDYDVILLDLGAGIDNTVRNFSALADQIVVITTDEPTALTDAYAFIKLIHATGRSDLLRLVINMVGDARDGQRTYGTLLKVCQNFLKMTPVLAGSIRRDRHVREAIRNQMPLLTRSPNCDAAEDVERIAAQLVSP